MKTYTIESRYTGDYTPEAWAINGTKEFESDEAAEVWVTTKTERCGGEAEFRVKPKSNEVKSLLQQLDKIRDEFMAKAPVGKDAPFIAVWHELNNAGLSIIRLKKEYDLK